MNSRWRSDGVRIIRAGELDSNTPQTPGMQRRAAVTTASTGATQLWAGTVTIDWTAIAANTRLPADRAPVSAVVYPLAGGLPGDEPEEPG